MAGPRDWWRLELAYDGTPFDGWARQPGRRTVEGELEAVLETVLRERVRLHVAGRTDAGVHALAQVASFSTDASDLEARRLRLSLNSLLPAEISVTTVARAAAGFDARAAAARTYRYRLWLSDTRPVFERLYVWDVRGVVDPVLLHAAAALLAGRRDFAALTPSARFYRSLSSARSSARGGRWRPTVARRVSRSPPAASCTTWCGWPSARWSTSRRGAWTSRRSAAGLAGGQRRDLGRTAPARGLALVKVDY